MMDVMVPLGSGIYVVFVNRVELFSNPPRLWRHPLPGKVPVLESSIHTSFQLPSGSVSLIRTSPLCLSTTPAIIRAYGGSLLATVSS